MKGIRRTSVSPPTLMPGGKGWKAAAARETIFLASKNNVKKVNSNFAEHWGDPDVRGALWAMQWRSCAYCDRELPGTDRGDVDHFRPKNIYWWLAYQFDNYLLACSACNSSYKIKRFPILPPDQAYTYANRAQIAQERRALIDPVADQPNGWFGIDFDAANVKRMGFQLTINPELGATETQRCEVTRTFFRLNIDSELLTERQVAVHDALELVNQAMTGDAASLQKLRRNAVRFRPHSFAVREVIVAQAKRPDYLPSIDEEVTWLVDELIKTLHHALNALQKIPKDHKETNQRNRCAWALAVLMKDPPGLSTEAIRKWLEEEKVLEIVEPIYNSISSP